MYFGIFAGVKCLKDFCLLEFILQDIVIVMTWMWKEAHVTKRWCATMHDCAHLEKDLKDEDNLKINIEKNSRFDTTIKARSIVAKGFKRQV